MREQFDEGRLPHTRTRQMFLQRVPEVDHPLIAQLEDQYGGERLGDGADAVLHVLVRRMSLHRRPHPCPYGLSAPHHGRDERRSTLLRLGDGNPVQQCPTRAGQQFFLMCRHALSSPGAGSARTKSAAGTPEPPSPRPSFVLVSGNRSR